MKVVIDSGQKIKVLGRVFHCLGKIGDELYMETQENEMAFRTVNSCRSCYACFTFSKKFFKTFNATEEEFIKCKLCIKSLLPIFKNTSFLEKSIVKCKIELDLNADRLKIKLYRDHGIAMSYNLFFTECETLQAVFDKSESVNCIVGETKLFSDAIQNFQSTNHDELILVVRNDKVVLRNFVEDEPDPAKAVHTELLLEPEEFTTYDITEPGEVTFAVKELRALLSFAETVNYDLSVHFEKAGKPIIFSFTENPTTFQADFVLATVLDEEREIAYSDSESSGTVLSLRGRGRGKNKKVITRKKKTTNGFSGNSARSSPSINSVSITDYLSKPSTSKDNSRISIQQSQTNERNAGNQTSFNSPTLSPPNKKLKSMFLALLESPQPIPDRNTEILASDSDDGG